MKSVKHLKTSRKGYLIKMLPKSMESHSSIVSEVIRGNFTSIKSIKRIKSIKSIKSQASDFLPLIGVISQA